MTLVEPVSAVTSYGVGIVTPSVGHSEIRERTHEPGTPKIIVVPSATGAAITMLNNASQRRVWYPLADWGYGFASFDHTHLWGNDVAQARLAAEIAYATAQGHDPLYICTGSGGLLTTLNYLIANPGHQIVAVASNVGAVDVQHIYDGDIGGYQAFIAAAYGGARPPDSHNPIDNLDDYDGTPLLCCHSTNDPYTTVAMYGQLGNEAGVELHSWGAVAHGEGGPDPAPDVYEFSVLAQEFFQEHTA